MKRIIVALVVLALITGAVFAGGQPEADPGTEREVRQISIAGAGSAGTFYVMATGFADLINQTMGINSVSEVTAGSVENAGLIDEQQVEFGVMQLDVAQNALAGTAQFDSPRELMAVTPMYPNLVQIVTLKDSDIETFDDLRGKRVSVGSPGSGILATNRVILETLGMTLDDIRPQYLSFAETTTAFRDGAVDAVIVNTAAPAPFLVDLETTHPLKTIELTDEQISAFTDEYAYYVEATIPADAYQSIDEETSTFAVWITLMTYPDMPEQVVYDVVKTIHENSDFLADVHVVSKYVRVENVPSITGVPFHPGAARYYAEQGVEVPTE